MRHVLLMSFNDGPSMVMGIYPSLNSAVLSKTFQDANALSGFSYTVAVAGARRGIFHPVENGEPNAGVEIEVTRGVFGERTFEKLLEGLWCR